MTKSLSDGVQHAGTKVHSVYRGTQGESLYGRTFTGSISNVGLLARLNEVMEENGWNARDWAKAAGLAEETHLYTIVRRLKANPDHKLDVITLTALADAAGVTLDWLALGRPPKRSAAGRADPRYPSRSQALVAAHLIGLPEEAIRIVAAVDDVAADPGTEYWLQRVRLVADELRAPRLLPPHSGPER